MTRFPETQSVDPSSCIFCRIVAGDAPCHRVYEDADVLAFMDIRPVGEGHTLVIPKAHHGNLLAASDGILDDFRGNWMKVHS